jgi:hypothetical protein
MTLWTHTAAAAISFIAFTVGANAQGIDYSKISIITTQLAPSVNGGAISGQCGGVKAGQGRW